MATGATLELPVDPPGRGRATFADLDDDADAVYDAVRSGVDVARIELADPAAAAVANRLPDTDLPDAPMVFVEFHANHGADEVADFCRGSSPATTSSGSRWPTSR